MNIEVTYVVDVSRDGRRVATGFNPSPVECSPFNIGPMPAVFGLGLPMYERRRSDAVSHRPKVTLSSWQPPVLKYISKYYEIRQLNPFPTISHDLNLLPNHW